MNPRTVLFGIVVLGCTASTQAFAAAAATDPDDVRKRLAALSVPFVPNAGQWDQQAAFAAQTFAGTLFVTTEGTLVYSLPGKRIAGHDDARTTDIPARRGHERGHAVERTPGWVLTETFLDDKRQAILARPRGERQAAAIVSYFIGGDAQQHRSALHTYEQIELGEVFTGIDVALRATGTNVEKIFTVAPGHDPGQIRLRIGGADTVELGPEGELIAHTGNGPLTYTAPIAFQKDSDGNRHPVAVRYALDTHARHYGFTVGDYDKTRSLVIDPLVKSTYLGSGGQEETRSLAIHPGSGDIYVAGTTSSAGTTFPGVTGGAQGGFGLGPHDAFVSRFNADLTTLIKSTYLGAAGDDFADALAIHPISGQIYVAGHTSSLTTTFPGVSGGFQGNYGGGTFDAFVSRLSLDLTTLIKSTYLGAGGNDVALALAIHPISGDVYVAGYTTSDASTFPQVSGSPQATYGGDTDAFVSRFSADLVTLHKSSYLGNTGQEMAWGLAVHPASGDVYVAGGTSSTGATFPGVGGGAQGIMAGLGDAFVSRFTDDLSTLVQSTYVGAATTDVAHAVAIHPLSGDIYIAGLTNSIDSTFPGAGSGAQDTFGGTYDAFVSRLSPDLTTLIKSTYFGAGGSDPAYSIAIHPVSGEIYIAGYTDSPGTTLPGTSGGAQPSAGTLLNAYVSRFSPDLTLLLKSTYLGAVGDDIGQAVAIHPVSGDVYVSGYTTALTNAFPGVAASAQANSGGGQDVFVSRFTRDLTLFDTVANPFALAAQNNVPVLSLRTSAPVQITGLGASTTAYVDGQFGSSLCVSGTNTCATCSVSGTFVTSGLVSDGQYVCVRHRSSPLLNAITSTTLRAGGQAATFRVSTANLLSACTLDVDGNNAQDPLTDGLIIMRSLFGMTGTAVTSGALGTGASRTTWAQIQPWLNGNCGTNFAP